MDASGIVVTVKLENPRLSLWLATACWHGLKWKAVGETREEAVEKARAAAATGVWCGHPMAEMPQYHFLASLAAEAKVEVERRRPVSLRDPSAIPYQIGFAAGVRWLSGKIGPDELERSLNG